MGDPGFNILFAEDGEVGADEVKQGAASFFVSYWFSRVVANVIMSCCSETRVSELFPCNLERGAASSASDKTQMCLEKYCM